jgi:broad specificity phosphatase PhoE
MKIYAIRHGLTDLNKKGLINGYTDSVLEPEGIEQAKMVAQFLPKTIKHIYSSSLGRTKQTAEILNGALNVLITFHDELKEVNFGILEATPFLEEFKKKHRTKDYDWRPSGESFEDVKKRVLKILEVIKAERGQEEALIVTHGGIIRLMHMLEFGQPLEEVDNASLHSFDLDKILK